MDDIDDLFDAAAALAFERLAAVGEDVRKLDVPLQTVAIVVAVQGVIDNGGLLYLLGPDWPGQPPYSLFADAYRRIGALAEAEAIDRAAALFPFPEPERDAGRRKQWFEAGGRERILALGTGSSDVEALLCTYVASNRAAFTRGA